MACFVNAGLASAPDFVSADFLDFKRRAPDIHRRAEIEGIFHTGRGLLGDDTPRQLRLTKRRATLPDIFVTASGAFVVSSRLAHLIEAMDPGLHQLIPIEVERGPDNDPPGFILNVHHYQQSVIHEASEIVKNYGSNRILSLGRRNPPPRVVIDPSRLDGSNLWREQLYRILFVSDTFYDEIAVERIKFFPISKAVTKTIHSKS